MQEARTLTQVRGQGGRVFLHPEPLWALAHEATSRRNWAPGSGVCMKFVPAVKKKGRERGRGENTMKAGTEG